MLLGDESRALLRLTLTPGIGPVLIARLLSVFGSAGAALEAGESALAGVRGVGASRARAIRAGARESAARVDDELAEVEAAGAHVVTLVDEAYPALLRATAGAPAALYVKGDLSAARARHAAAIVGSRGCSAYGVEQARRFSMGLAQAGLAVVSGGARGIDAAAHDAALRALGRTVAVMGCGLRVCYPPEHDELYARIVEGGGALVSELPMRTSPAAENFPARNRIISGLSLGVVVIEAGRGSGALITSRLALEQGRESMALPGRVDSPASEGSNGLIRDGGAALVTSPAEVVAILDRAAVVLSATVDGATPAREEREEVVEAPEMAAPAAMPGGMTEPQRLIYEALDRPRTVDELTVATGLEASRLLAETTVLEIRRLVGRRGDRLERVRRG